MVSGNLRKTLLAGALLLASTAMVFAGGNSEAPASTGKLDKNIKATITLPSYGASIMDVYNNLQLEKSFQKYYPNVSIEIEQFKDSEDYMKNMKIRASANQLPDIMLFKPFSIAEYKEFLLPLDDAVPEVIANNSMASAYAIDGTVYAIPSYKSCDLLLYWEDMLQEAGAKVPETWPELLETTQKVQDYFSKQDPDFITVALGAKDEWPTYPYVEFMPMTITGNGNA